MDLSLYIHVPFCSKKCDYCDFFSIPHSEHAIVKPDERYVEAVLNEAAFYVNHYNISSWNTIYIGGGTPSQLGGNLLEKLITGVLSLVSNTHSYREITVELNPDDITQELIKSLEKAGVNRISMGIQALDDRALKIINRRCTALHALNALELLKENWHGRLSVDFIAGLPGQTLSSFEKQFEILEQYPVGHVSLYTLTVEENTPLYRKIQSGEVKFSQERADRMWIKGRNILEKMGYSQYEVSNFCVPDNHSRHNTVYWNLDSYIGCGAGASGSVYQDQLRWTNTTDIKKYEDFWLSLENKELNVHKFRQDEEVSQDVQEFEYLMMGFRKLSGVSSKTYRQRFNASLEDRLGIKNGLFRDWTDRRLTKIEHKDDDVFYSLNRRGIMLLNQFLESLL